MGVGVNVVWSCSGNALMTVATGELSEKDKDRSGLVPLHAYAILDVRSVTVGDVNHQLLQLKNPWHHQRWKGNFSEQDDNWTPELKKALHFDQMQALRDDNGEGCVRESVGVSVMRM
jgi:calpain-7